MFCVCARRDHSILHGHYGIHYHLNDAPVEASICWLTVAWEVSSLFSVHAVYPILLAGGLQSCWPTPVLTSRWWRWWWVGIGGKVDGACSLPWECVALLRLIINDRSGGH